MTSTKEYVYFPPNNAQFFFPKEAFKDFENYYTPYSLKAKIFWSLFKNISVVRNQFTINEEQVPLPMNIIKSVLKLDEENYHCLLNAGTRGEEQTTTVIYHTREQQVFLKLAQKTTARQLVKNEYLVLKELESQDFFKAPEAFNFEDHHELSYSALTTEVLEANKLQQVELSENLLSTIIGLNELKPFKKNRGNITYAFAHGDFCPWNLLTTTDGTLCIIDWEMAGFKPLGYDLFTFLFQTAFLLMPKKPISTIISNNEGLIKRYFDHFNVNSWYMFLTEFASLKLEKESKKEGSILTGRYQELLNYGKGQ